MNDPVHVLIVDDEPAIRQSLAEFLNDYGFKVVTAESAEEALAIVKNGQLEIALVDIRLPKMDGDTLIAQAHEVNPKMRFLIHTGSVEYKLPKELERIGLRQEHIFLKPVVDLTVIVDAIQKILYR